jgi:hypothetical protein
VLREQEDWLDTILDLEVYRKDLTQQETQLLLEEMEVQVQMVQMAVLQLLVLVHLVLLEKSALQVVLHMLEVWLVITL